MIKAIEDFVVAPSRMFLRPALCIFLEVLYNSDLIEEDAFESWIEERREELEEVSAENGGSIPANAIMDPRLELFRSPAVQRFIQLVEEEDDEDDDEDEDEDEDDE